MDVWLNIPEIFVALDPLVPPVNPGVNEGSAQLYFVLAGITPLVGCVGVTVKATPEHVEVTIVLILGVG
jgi:hypothetical protein